MQHGKKLNDMCHSGIAKRRTRKEAMKRSIRFITLILLVLATGRCFALNATFVNAHACVHSDDAWRCHVVPKDALLRFSTAFYGRGASYKVIQMASFIKNANRIYPGMIIVIPDTTPASILTDAPSEAAMQIPAEEVAQTTIPLPAFASAETTETTASSRAPMIKARKTTCYTYIANGNLRGALETKLLLFDNNDEKAAMVPSSRISLKDSWATPTKNGKTIIFIRLAHVPDKPFSFLVGGVNSPIDGNDATPYAGRFPGPHKVLRTIGKEAIAFGISTLAVGPVGAAAVVTIPALVRFGMAKRAAADERKLASLQAVVDRNHLALYRAQNQLTLIAKEAQ